MSLPAAMTERRILLVEDSRTMRVVMRRFLESTGYLIFEAGDGEEALRLAARERPDVILLDLQIPLLDGYGVLAALQTDPELGEVPVVLVTSRNTPEDVAEGLARGAHDYLRKPFQQPELIARVHAAMRTKMLRDELRARNAQLERLVTTDLVTGLLNRLAAGDRLRELVSRSERHGPALSVLVLDVDGFRGINAVHGHNAGDAVLEAVASRVRTGLRDEDVAARWGADELLVMAPDTGEDGAARLLTRLRRAVSAEPVAIGAERLAIAISAGMATWVHGDDAGAVVSRAEEALWSERDRVGAARQRRTARPSSDRVSPDPPENSPGG
ncbi:MAG: two-component system, cell cycle response regulator [Solirubrobacteraceae bacterium]|nr:two-component system, cell cycle response regulator [Solirubrobacteraceae bacterium]